MRQRSRTSVSPSGSELLPSRTPCRNDGAYAFIILMMLVTVLLISLTAALPNIYTQGQREKEEELIFRGQEYARAIGLFRRQFRRFPTSVKELLETNGIRFLRREYPDPMSRKGKWRFIHADATGTPIDSRTLTRPKLPKPLGDSSSTDSSPTSKPDSESENESQEKSAFFGDGKQIQGAFIIGVASASNMNSIRVYNNKTRYSDWEFLGIELGAGSAVPGQGSGVPGGAQPGGVRSPSPQGGGGFSMMPQLSGQPLPKQ